MARRKKRCFYIAPIGEHGTPTRMQSDTALEYVVRPALSDRYVIKRADEDLVPRQISPQLIRDINEADLVVCDLTGLRPNVMYELGVAHTLAKPVIQIADVETVLPFDINQTWTIFFKVSDPWSHKKAGADIRQAEQSLRQARRISNLVTDSLGRFTHEDFRNGTSGFDEQFQWLKTKLQDLERQAWRRPAADPVGTAIDRAERALKSGPPPMRAGGPRSQAEAAGQVIDLLAGRRGFERVAVDRMNERRLVVYGDPSLDTSEVDRLVDGFDVEFRLAPRSA